MRKISVQVVIFLWCTLILLIVSGTTIFLSMTHQQVTQQQILEAAIEKNSYILNTVINHFLVNEEISSLVSILSALQNSDRITSLRLYQPDGKIAFNGYTSNIQTESSQTTKQYPDFNSNPLFEEVLRSTLPQIDITAGQIDALVPIFDTVDCNSCDRSTNDITGILHYQISLGEMSNRITINNVIIIVIHILLILIAVVFLVLFIRRMIGQPMRSMNQMMQSIIEGNWDVKSEMSAKNEFGTLSQQLNMMIESVKNKINMELEIRTTKIVDSANKKYLSIIREGFLHIDRDRKITPLYSSSLTSLFETDIIAGRRLEEFLYPAEPPDSDARAEVQEFVDILFEGLNTDTVDELNPLQRKRILVAGRKDSKYITVDGVFHPTWKDGKVINIMVTLLESGSFLRSSVPPHNLIEFRHSVEILVSKIDSELKKTTEVSIRGNIQDLPCLPKLQPALLHLVRNAMEHGIRLAHEQHGDREGRGKIELVFTKQDSDYKIIVADNGRGIDFSAIERRVRHLGFIADQTSNDELIKLLFSPKFTVDQDTNRAEGGLHMVQHTIRSLNGKISVYTKEGLGTHFTITIPR